MAFQRHEAEYSSYTWLPAVRMSNLEKKLEPQISYLMLHVCIHWSAKIKHTFTFVVVSTSLV